MGSGERQARHVFHVPTSGWDRIHAWQEATGEPVFTWGWQAGLARGSTFGPIRRAFLEWLEASGEGTPMTLYHDGAGADALGPLDPAPFKVLFLHTWTPRWEASLNWYLRSTGKLLVGNGQAREVLRERFRWIPDRHIGVVRQPLLSGQANLVPKPEAAKRRTGIWLHGVSWRRHGNRLRAIADRWQEADGELEVITEGPSRPRWARGSGLTWSTGMPLEFALYRLFTWDSVLLLNDFSLDAPWFLRALAHGCFPLVPEGDHPARDPAWSGDSAPRTFPWGDLPAALERLQQWREQRVDLLADFQEWTGQLVGHHPPAEAFGAAWEAAKGALMENAPPRLAPRKPLAKWYPTGWHERVNRLRGGQ